MLADVFLGYDVPLGGELEAEPGKGTGGIGGTGGDEEVAVVRIIRAYVLSSRMRKASGLLRRRVQPRSMRRLPLCFSQRHPAAGHLSGRCKSRTGIRDGCRCCPSGSIGE